MSEIILTSKILGAKENAKGLSDVTVQTGRVFVGAAEYDETDYTEAQDVEVGVFMDGTWNNRNNTDARKEYEKMQKGEEHNPAIAAKYINDDIKSFESEYSNIARMEPHYKEESTEKLITFPIYIEGVGTENYEEDSGLGGGLGIGDTGITAKMEKACKMIVKNLSKREVEKINMLTIDVFGFSRGAAAARHLIHEITKMPRRAQYHGRTGEQTQPAQPRHGLLGKWLEKEGITLRILTVRFVGLYDTVSAHGLGVAASYDNDTEQLHLDAIRKARHTLQLTADDEHRRNFSLINIDSARAAGRGEEYALPGVHADVGGSYTAGEQEVRMFDTAERDYVLGQGWYTPDQLKVIEMQRERGQPIRFIEGTRALPKVYSYLPLRIMTDKMSENQLPFNATDLKSDYQVHGDLKQVNDRLYEYVFGGRTPLEFRPVEELNQQLADGELTQQTHRRQLQDSLMLMKLRNNYLHFSARFRNVVNSPRRTFWSSRRKREINDG